MNESINQSMDQSIDKSKPKCVLPIILRTAEECFFLKPFLRKRPSKTLKLVKLTPVSICSVEKNNDKRLICPLAMSD